jgi:predicted transcriptional regulator
MTTQLTINLPDEVYHRVQQLAARSNRDVSDILTDTIQWFLPLLALQSQFQEPISILPDEQVLTLTELQMEAKQDQKLSDLLDRQQAGVLTEIEQLELQVLMQVYQVGLLRKATALSEAVKRKLSAPLSS